MIKVVIVIVSTPIMIVIVYYRLYLKMLKARYRNFYILHREATLTYDIMRGKKNNTQEIEDEFELIHKAANRMDYDSLRDFYP